MRLRWHRMRRRVMGMTWSRARRPLAAIAAAIGVLCLMQAAWIEVKACTAQALIEAAWERNQLGALSARPWPWADTTPVARLSVLERNPRSVSMPPQYASPRGEPLIVLEGASGRNLAFGPTHDAASVLPGDAGNSVIAAHRDTHFKMLETLAPGDRLQVERVDGQVTFFAVTDIRIVDSRTTRIAAQRGRAASHARDLLSLRRYSSRRAAALRRHRGFHRGCRAFTAALRGPCGGIQTANSR